MDDPDAISGAVTKETSIGSEFLDAEVVAWMAGNERVGRPRVIDTNIGVGGDARGTLLDLSVSTLDSGSRLDSLVRPCVLLHESLAQNRGERESRSGLLFSTGNWVPVHVRRGLRGEGPLLGSRPGVEGELPIAHGDVPPDAGPPLRVLVRVCSSFELEDDQLGLRRD